MSEGKRNPNPGAGISHEWDCTHNPCRCKVQMTFPDYEAAKVELARFNISDKDVDAAIHAALGDRVLYSTNEPDAEEIHDLIAIGMLHPEWPKDALTEEDNDDE